MATGAETQAPRRRSDATRAAILEAARERFASDGYERATVRSIAHDAAIDPSMVMRYFGSKEGLFAAVVDVELDFPDLAGTDPGSVGVVLVRHFLDLWERDGVLRTLLRVGMTNSAGADRLRDVFRSQLVPAARSFGHPDAERRAALVASQVLGMAVVRYVLRLEPAAALSHDEVVAWLAPTVQRYLTAEEP
ncbi:TetR family transcriptional regulator [Promicromonospora citrea]|nr:TetR family transcriptional regulator [Promicromonospora citrea]NNH52725.1 TetR/AcrR family transcriptional regulator [Promicromonospora citrea]